ncbi:MAG TPA: PSD1 and planctomycete cytochrome C domain-containing protein [Bryobacteraceae bacterium]|nr:PSD1 and planctomycete cytochrome C domain-containing protein [Bryobacteraceae bacterium]
MTIRFLVLAACLTTYAMPAYPEVTFIADIEPLLKKRCHGCHGAQLQMGGLRLDNREDALAGGYSGSVIKPGESNTSKLIALVSGTEAGKVMPPAGPRLSEHDVATLRAWIDRGAEWPAGISKQAMKKTSSHWAFQPLKKPAVPGTGNPIDAFVLDRLQSEQLAPSPEADKRTLLRRLSFDLIGLPPTREEMSAFLADEAPAAYERQVDRLLGSPHFGEKWARHWLDLARYADSDGYEQDGVRPHAWRYRDWVIRALNADMPFDQFTIEQIAGDLLPGSTVSQKMATGFHRNTLTSREGGIDVEQLRTDQVADRANTVASVWLGLTFECAKCHDHKYDPISQKEYYQLYAFFNTGVEVNHIDPMPGEVKPYLQSKPEFERMISELIAKYKVDKLQPVWEREVLAAIAKPEARLEWTQVADYLKVYVDHGQEIVKTPPLERSYQEKLAMLRVFLKYPGPLSDNAEAKTVRFGEGFKQLEDLLAAYPTLSEVPAVAENPTPPRTHMHLRGDFRSPGIEVQPGTLAVLPPLDSSAKWDRLALARWIASAENPLTARVAVNRVFQELFGRGLVTTSEDFGARGDPPSYPKLLDWLSAEFIDKKWSLKAIVKTIVMSSTYRQSSHARQDLQTLDPANRLLARQSRHRLPAELIRDNALAVSGLLNTAIGGKSVRPPMPSGVMQVAYRATWKESEGPDRYRRGLYTFVQRSVPYPQQSVFDAPTALVSCSRRERSTTPIQALNLLNDPVFWEAAQSLAARTLQDKSSLFKQRARYVYELALGRAPSDDELRLLFDYYSKRSGEVAAWTGISSIVLNLDEFITRE